MCDALPTDTAQHWVNENTVRNLLTLFRNGDTTELIDAMTGPVQAIVNHFMPTKAVLAVAAPSGGGGGGAPGASSQPQVKFFPHEMLADFIAVRTLRSYLMSPSRLFAEDNFPSKFTAVIAEIDYVVSWDNREHPFWKRQPDMTFMLAWVDFARDLKAWMPKDGKHSRWIKYLTEVLPAKAGEMCSPMEKAGLKMMYGGRTARSKSRSRSRSRSPSKSRSRTSRTGLHRGPPQAKCPICNKNHDKIAQGGCSRCGKPNHSPRNCRVRTDVCGVPMDNRSSDTKYRRYV
jgi:hypothetical protein